jgi:hypothetical protein
MTGDTKWKVQAKVICELQKQQLRNAREKIVLVLMQIIAIHTSMQSYNEDVTLGSAGQKTS